MKTFALALVMLAFVTASALAETCNKQHLQEDVSRCIKNKDNVGHDRVVSGATSGDADKLDAGLSHASMAASNPSPTGAPVPSMTGSMPRATFLA